MTSKDGSVTLGVADGKVSMKLSDRVIEDIRKNLKQHETSGPPNDLSRMISSMVQKSVGEAVTGGVSRKMEVPIDEIAEIEYRDDRIAIQRKGGGEAPFSGVFIDGKPALAMFDPDDARRFVETVNQVKSGR